MTTRQHIIKRDKDGIAVLMTVTEHHEEEILREWGEAMGWEPCKQEGDA